MANALQTDVVCAVEHSHLALSSLHRLHPLPLQRQRHTAHHSLTTGLEGLQEHERVGHINM